MKDIDLKKQKITTFEEAVDYLYNMPRFTSKNSPEDTKAYLHKLGDPDKKMKIIHVAGTNGKGSVCSYMRYVLEEAGYRVALFTSPHLSDVRERFLINGQMIDKESFMQAFLQIYEGLNWENLEKGEGYHPTFFEYLFFMAMIIFPKYEIDYCILETGLGGRLDATNAVETKELSVITRISLEHVEYLGDTIEKIAGEKAGIMRPGVPIVFSDVVPEATKVFEEQGVSLGSLLYPVSNNDYAFLNFKNKSIDFSLHTRYYGYIRLTLQTIARYQMENAALAVRAIEVLDQGKTITKQHIVNGICRCIWQGRMEEVLPDVYVDGAHNEDGIRAFIETVKADDFEGTKTLLFSVVSDKDYRHMIEQIGASGLFQKVAIAPMQTGRAASLQKMSEIFSEYVDSDCILYDNVKEAFVEIVSNKTDGERIYIAGSLYLVGEIKDMIGDLKETLSDD